MSTDNQETQSNVEPLYIPFSPYMILDVTLKPGSDRNQNFEDLIRKCDILEGESEDL